MPAPEGTLVRVRMRLHVGVVALLVLWFGGALFAFAVTLRDAVSGRESGLKVLVAAAMAFVAYAFVILEFHSEAAKARTLLRDGLGCRDAERTNRLVR